MSAFRKVKLRALRVQGEVLVQIVDFLTDRCQRVCINGQLYGLGLYTLHSFYLSQMNSYRDASFLPLSHFVRRGHHFSTRGCKSIEGGAVTQSVERATPGEQVPGSVPAAAACVDVSIM